MPRLPASLQRDAAVGTEREHSLVLLAAIKIALRRPGPLLLTDVEREYLSDTCDRAAAGDADPLRIGRGSGGQRATQRLFAEARMVHEYIKAGATVRAACEAVGGSLARDGGKSGAVEKNYRRNRGALEAADRFYAALAAGREPDAADIKSITGTKGRGK
jgi:hypothetical protein